VAAIGEAAGEPLQVAFEEGDQVLVARLSGAGEALLLDQGGKGLRALEHIMQRALAPDEPRRLLLTSERYRAERDLYLRERALQLASAVRSDGTARETEPLNAYDRRIVHLAIQDEPGLRSFSVGEGSARRVTVAPAASDAGGPAPEAG
jgi:spoIIIJ-associated protein